ncbi:hypothetical protein RU86_GL002229 [Lactococcus piscium]|uniref:Sugar transporter n=1 Tax=Pseudolactococcus piscium TaxID=1364 RepID=A0A2A5RZV9_9LACT|nr:hypothetical protein [Lactococcus piscium]PCS06786.1 hypothetical protein RU86_GL002229 [Lactococcus piscium]
MTPKEKKQFEANRQSTGIKVMTYNRFLLIRYVGDCLFFINLYTVLLYLLSHSNLIIIPILLILSQLPAIWEQIKLYSTPISLVKFTKGYFILQTLVFIGSLIIATTPLFNRIFPFLNASVEVRIGVAISSGLFALICLAMLGKIRRISINKDKQYQRIQQYKQSLPN